MDDEVELCGALEGVRIGSNVNDQMVSSFKKMCLVNSQDMVDEPSPSVGGPPVVKLCTAMVTDTAFLQKVAGCCAVQRGTVANVLIENDAKGTYNDANDDKLSCEADDVNASSGDCLESNRAVSASDSLYADLEQN